MHLARTMEIQNRKRFFTPLHAVQDDKLNASQDAMLHACLALAEVQHDRSDRTSGFLIENPA